VKIAKGEQWHKDLLVTAKAEGLIPEEISATLEGMLKFRHVQIHRYPYTFEEEKLRHFSHEALKSYPIF
jgi:uncharacterized protein YutE (UPF0331/DUF86 family)